MSQLAQLSEAEIEERFHIPSRTAIQFMLAGFAREHESFSVQFGSGQEVFLTTLLAVQPDSERLIVDCSGSPDANRHFLASDHNTFVGYPGGIQVHFVTGAVSEVMFEGAKAFAVQLPKVLVRLQRREHFRIETPRINPVFFVARLPDGSSLKWPAHDLSVAGIGLNAPEIPAGLVVGLQLERCSLLLPEVPQPVLVSATVCNILELETRGGHRQLRVGLQFASLPASDENRIQRYIARIEHERRDLA